MERETGKWKNLPKETVGDNISMTMSVFTLFFKKIKSGNFANTNVAAKQEVQCRIKNI
jgi:hypothetical protein